jgi:hypothetical protein
MALDQLRVVEWVSPLLEHDQPTVSQQPTVGFDKTAPLLVEEPHTAVQVPEGRLGERHRPPGRSEQNCILLTGPMPPCGQRR